LENTLFVISPFRTLDPRAVTLYENALEVLGKRRYSAVYPADIRAAYSDLEEAASLGHRDAEKILGTLSIIF
jgi:hypothetical protein